jgi:hypothetical protein
MNDEILDKFSKETKQKSLKASLEMLVSSEIPYTSQVKVLTL